MSRRLLSLTLLLLLPTTTALAAAPSFTVNMSEAVTVTGTPRIAVDVGGVTRYATYASGSGTSSLTFTYSPQEGDLDLDGISLSSPVDLNGGTITDLNGNPETNLTFTVPDTSGVKIDYPSLSMDFVNDDYILSGTHYNSLSSFLSAAGGTFSRNSVATYFDNTGTMQTASANIPRFDHDPVTHAAKGILLEESRINHAQHSSDVGDAYWFKTAASVVINGTTSPDGTLSADLVIPNTSTTYHEIYHTLTVTSGSYYTASVFAKAAGDDWIYINLVSGTNHFAIFNISTGTVGNSSAVDSATITDVGNGWYRCAITAQTSNTSAGVNFHITGGNNVSPWAGDGTSGVYLWGMQLEAGRFPTSYLPTTAGTVSRGEDLLTIPTDAWYNASVGTFYDDISWISSAGTSYPMFFRVFDGTVSNRWNLFYSQSGNQIGIDSWSSGNYQGGFSTAVSTSGSIRAASAQELNNTNASFDGVLKTLDTNWTVPSVTQLNLSGSAARKWHKKIKYYPARVSDTQLQLLTQ